MPRFVLKCFRVSLGCGLLISGTTLAEWDLVWSDEFDGNGELDQSKWNFESFEPGANNNELQKYTWNRTENCRRQDGVLVLEGRRDWWFDQGNGQTYEYTSARIQTAGKFSIKYGKIEMRALMPWANGSWPAFWMMPQNGLYGGWPDSGEIDILEYVGWDNDVAHVNAHTKDHNFLLGTNYGWSGWVGGLENSYHTYTVEWWHDRIDFYIDGVWRYGFTNEDTGPGQWPFNSEFFIILNHAIGGDWGGVMGIDTGAYDTGGDNYGVGYFVDYVRAYKWDWPDHDIPAHVEAERYEGYGGDIREQKCADLGGGWNVGYIDTGDYMQYRFNVPESAWYQIDYRVASDSSGGIVSLGKGGVDIKQTAIPDTGGWQDWETVSDLATLEKGSQTLTVFATVGGWNLNWWSFELLDPDYAAWEDSYGIGGAGRSGNSDGDQWGNEAEYYFGYDPTSSSEDPARMPSTWIETSGGSFPAFTFTRRIDAPEVNYLVEVSEDLTTWSECLRSDGGSAVNSYTQLSASEDHGDGSQTVRIRYNIDLSAISGKMFFFRIRVSE